MGWMLIIPAQHVRAGRHESGGSSGSPSEMQGGKQPGEELRAAMDVQRSRTADMDGDCFYQLGLISEVSSLADSDIRDLDFDSVNVGAYTH